MELIEIKKLISYFEDRIINNFETHFSELVLMDFYEGGYDGRLSDELFYEEYFEPFEKDITNLLLLIENERSEEYQDFKIRLIKMKRIIDTKLKNIQPISIESKQTRTSKRNSQFIINLGINKEKFVTVLFNSLQKSKLINTTLESFQNHFSENWDNKIQWLGTELQITNLISNLIINQYLDPETVNFKYKLIASHFENKNNKPFIEKQLASVYSEKRESLPTDDITNRIFTEMNTHL